MQITANKVMSVFALAIVATTVSLSNPANARTQRNHSNHHYARVVYPTTPFVATDPLTLFLNGLFGQPQPTTPVARVYNQPKPARVVLQYDPSKYVLGASTQNTVYSMIASRVTERIGSQWVATAYDIMRIETGGKCYVRNSIGATGIYQVRWPERFGISTSQAMTCEGGIAAGVEHMAMCIQKGATTWAQMLTCHNSGDPFFPKYKLEPAYQRAILRHQF
jgi:hypothetical protein